jgi:hypothetical protein
MTRTAKTVAAALFAFALVGTTVTMTATSVHAGPGFMGLAGLGLGSGRLHGW